MLFGIYRFYLRIIGLIYFFCYGGFLNLRNFSGFNLVYFLYVRMDVYSCCWMIMYVWVRFFLFEGGYIKEKMDVYEDTSL